MGIKDIYIGFQHHGRGHGEGIAMGITIQEFSVDDDSQKVEIEGYEISLDYEIGGKPHKFDHIALMVHSMLNDRHDRRLQEKIFDEIHPEDMGKIEAACRKEWKEYRQDVVADHGLEVGEQFLI